MAYRYDESAAEQLDPHARISDPVRVAATTSGRALLLVAIAGAGYVIPSRGELSTAGWLTIGLIMLGIVAVCVTYAFLGARFGRRTARRAVVYPLAMGLVLGMYALTRYLDQR